jgi:phosphonopyruvate decarboxylase
LLSSVADDPALDHLDVTSEAEAVGVAAGAWLTGRSPALVMQNSGFCDAINPILSLLETYTIPLPIIVSVRGGFGVADHPQHDRIGACFLNLVAGLGLPCHIVESDEAMVERRLIGFLRDRAADGRTGVIAVPVGVLEPGSTRDRAGRSDGCVRPAALATDWSEAPTGTMPGDLHCGPRGDVLAAVVQSAPPDSIFVSSTGYISRDLYTLGDAPSRLYVAGSMGCASAIGLGIARYCRGTVVILDGDGAALMKMGNLATIANTPCGRLIHVILNNGVFESTGGQFTFGRHVDFSGVARACGYAPESARVRSTEDLRRRIRDHCQSDRPGGPILLDALIAANSPVPEGRPDVAPPEQALRLRRLLAAAASTEARRSSA